MRKTYDMLKTIITGNEKQHDEKELIKRYAINLNPNILAYFFISNFGAINTIQQNYPLLNEDDKSSYCLQELDNALKTFDINKQVKFTTYFLTCLKNRYRTLTENEMLKYKRANIGTVDIDNCLDLCDTNNYLELDLDSYRLTNVEKKYCELLNLGYSIKEISNMINLSVSYLYKLNKIIYKKLIF